MMETFKREDSLKLHTLQCQTTRKTDTCQLVILRLEL